MKHIWIISDGLNQTTAITFSYATCLVKRILFAKYIFLTQQGQLSEAEFHAV